MDGNYLEDFGYITLAGALVAFNGFFVAAEFAMVKARATRIRELAEEGSFLARIARPVVEHADAYLPATQLGVTLGSLGLGWIGEPAVADILGSILIYFGMMPDSHELLHTIAFTIAFAIISFIHIVVGELVPKSLALREAENVVLWIAVPLRMFYVVTYPAIMLLNHSSRTVLWLMRVQPASEGDQGYSPEELRMIVASSHATGELNATEKRLLENVIDFSERNVAEIMTPRIDMVCLYADKSLAENLAIVQEHQATRYPLAKGDKDHILGMIHIKDLMRLWPTNTQTDVGGNLETIKRPITFVPETASIDTLLRTFQQQQSHLAVAVDEYGGASGLVTLEDVLEEIVGEIHDEFDSEEARTETKPNASLVQGGALLSDIAEERGFPVPEDAQVNTIGGYIQQLLGRVPRVGEGVPIGPYRAEVVAMQRNRVMKVRLRLVGISPISSTENRKSQPPHPSQPPKTDEK